MTSWLNDDPAPVDASGWALRVVGLVGEDLNIPYDALAESVEPTTATLDCTGLVLYPKMGGRAAKRGASPGRSKAPGAASVTIRSVTGYYRRFSLEDADAYLLATG